MTLLSSTTNKTRIELAKNTHTTKKKPEPNKKEVSRRRRHTRSPTAARRRRRRRNEANETAKTVVESPANRVPAGLLLS